MAKGKFPQFPSQLNETPPEQNAGMSKSKHFVPMVKMPSLKKFPRDGTERPCSTPDNQRSPK